MLRGIEIREREGKPKKVDKQGYETGEKMVKIEVTYCEMYTKCGHESWNA
jgi:hypothetical protein